MSQERRAEVYDAFGTILRTARDRLTSNLNNPPGLHRLWAGAFREARRINLDGASLSPEARSFTSSLAPLLLEKLEDQVNIDPGTVDPAEQAISLIHELADVILASAVSPEYDPGPFHFVPFEELVQRFPGRIRILTVSGQRELCLKADPSDKRSVHFRIPSSEHVVHKGGFPRVLLKIYSGAPESTIAAELPPNDFDVIGHDQHRDIVFKEATRLKADPDGVEFVDEMDFRKIFGYRDMDINCCVVTNLGLVFSQRALEAAHNGTIRINPTSVRIYGADMFYHQGMMLAKGRGLMRMMKFVAEGKALRFEVMPVNKQIDLGIYWLILARRFMKKASRAPETMQRLYYLAKQMEQVREGENDIFDLLDRVHTQFSFFDFTSPPLTREGVAFWLTRRLLKVIDYVFRQIYEIPSELNLRRSQGDNQYNAISLEGYKSSAEFTRSYKSRAKRFLRDCADRTA